MSERFILGTWGLSGPVNRNGKVLQYGHFTENDSFAVLDLASNLGIKLIDTAFAYGDGYCYALLKQWKSKRKKTFLPIIKVGRPIHNQIPVTRVQPQELFYEIENIISLIGEPNTILLKDPTLALLNSKQLNVLMECIKQKYDYANVGFSSHLLSEINLQKLGTKCIAQIEYNGINYRLMDKWIGYLKQNDWEVWSMQPLAYGFLSGKYSVSHIFAKNDWRFYLKKEKHFFLAKMAHYFLQYFNDFLPEYSAAEIAIAFCLAHPRIDKVIIGPKKQEQLHSAMRARALAESADFKLKCQICRSI
jgi:aryl-alcohol dehydrogenase-like predicted oxidoreductase